MFQLSKLKINGQVNTHKNLQITNNISINKYHATNRLEAQASRSYDFATLAKFNEEAALKAKIDKYVKEAFYLFKNSLTHFCFHDIISSNEEESTVTIIFLPISTSEATVPCGLQNFEKIHLNHYIKGFKNIYITRLLFQMTMTKREYKKWSSEYRYQNIKAKKAIFNEVQKDLENNHYSLLKDSDLLESNVEFFSKELPIVKFKFTDLDL